MAFDRTNSADLTALKDEVANDPISMGYQPVENTNDLLNLLNGPDNNVGGETSTERDFSGHDLLEICAANESEYLAVITSDLRSAFVQSIFAIGPEPVPARFKNEIMGLFSIANAPTIRAAIIAETTGLMSRAEVLFGDDTHITKRDWAAARDS